MIMYRCMHEGNVSRLLYDLPDFQHLLYAEIKPLFPASTGLSIYPEQFHEPQVELKADAIAGKI